LADWNAEQRRAQKEHLQRCARCSREHQELGWIEEGLQRLPEPSTAALAEARLQLRRRLAAPCATLPRRDRLRQSLLKAAVFVATIGLLMPATAWGFRQATPQAVVGTLQAAAGIWKKWELSTTLPALPWSDPEPPPEANG
jgi:anti-sigma factor RsiW